MNLGSFVAYTVKFKKKKKKPSWFKKKKKLKNSDLTKTKPLLGGDLHFSSRAFEMQMFCLSLGRFFCVYIFLLLFWVLFLFLFLNLVSAIQNVQVWYIYGSQDNRLWFWAILCTSSQAFCHLDLHCISLDHKGLYFLGE